MNTESSPVVGRWLRIALALALSPLFLTGCAPFVKVNQAHKISVTLPCAIPKQDQPVSLKVTVGEIVDVGPGTDNRNLTFDTTSASKIAITPQPLVIAPGDRSGSVSITVTDSGYAGHHFLAIFEESSKCPPGRAPFLGVTSFMVEPVPCPKGGEPPKLLQKHFKARKTTTPIGPKLH